MPYKPSNWWFPLRESLGACPTPGRSFPEHRQVYHQSVSSIKQRLEGLDEKVLVRTTYLEDHSLAGVGDHERSECWFAHKASLRHSCTLAYLQALLTCRRGDIQLLY